MVLRMMMRWAERRGFDVELLEASPGEEAGIKSATFRAAGENAYGLFSRREGRSPARAPVAVRLRQPPPDVVRRRRGRAGRRRGRARSRSTTTTCRSTPTAPRAPAASTSTRPTPRCASRTGRAGSSSSARTSARRRPTSETAMKMLRAKLLELEERKRAEEIAKERGEAQDVNFGSQIRSYVLHPYTMVKDHRTNFEMGDAQRVLDGDLDGFVRAELLRGARESRVSEQPTRPYLDAVVGLRLPRLRALPRPRPQGRPGRRPGAAPRARRAGAGDRRAAGHPGHRRRPVADALRARRAARRRGLRRAPLVVPDERRDAGQPRAVPRARAARGDRSSCSATRTPRSSTGSCSAAGCPAFVAPEYDPELGMAHGVTPEALAAALAAAPAARAAFIVSPTYYGMAADVAGCAQVAHDAGVPLDRRPVVGPAPRLPRRAAAERAGAGRRRRADEHAQARRLADPERDAAHRRRATGSTRSRSRAPCGSCARRARARCCWPRSTPRAASSPCTASSCCTRRSGRSTQARDEAATRSTASR